MNQANLFTLNSMGLIRYSCGHILGPPWTDSCQIWCVEVFIMLYQNMVMKMLKCKQFFFITSHFGTTLARPREPIIITYSLKKNRVNNSLHIWSEEISFVEEWISLDSNSGRVKIHYSTSGISSGLLVIHSKRSNHWRQYPGSDVNDK